MPRFLRPLLLVTLVAVFATPANAVAARPAAPSGTWIGGVTSTTATIRWSGVRGATSYEVLRNRTRIATVRTTSVRIIGLTPATWYTISIRARSAGGTSMSTDALPVVTTAPAICTRFASREVGSDRGTGAASAPHRTVQQLVDSWRPGDVGCVLGDTREDVNITRGGTASQPVVLRGMPSGRRTTISGRIQIARGADHVVVAGFDLDGRAVGGVGAGDLPSPTVNGNHARFLDNDVTNHRTRVCFVIGSIRGWGRARGTILARNRIHDCGRRGAGGHGNNHHHGIYVEGADDTRIVQNVIFQNADRGIQLYPDAQRTSIVGNVIDANGEGIIFSGAEGFASSGNVVLRNVVTNSRTRSDIEHWWENPARPGTGNRVVRNCVGGGRQGAFALPAVGYSRVANSAGRPAWMSAATGDYRLRSRAGTASCAAWLRSRGLPLRPFTR